MQMIKTKGVVQVEMAGVVDTMIGIRSELCTL